MALPGALRPHDIAPPSVAAIRLQSGLTQAGFAKLLGVSIRTLQEWEQGRRKPTGAAQTLIAIALHRPDVLVELITDKQTTIESEADQFNLTERQL